MEIDELKEKKLQKQLRKEAIRRNWKLFSQSKLGMIGLGIVLFFLVLALLQPFLFMTGLWNESIYHPVVGYDQIIENKIRRTRCHFFKFRIIENTGSARKGGNHQSIPRSQNFVIQ